MAAIQASQAHGSELIPLCHPLPITRVAVSFEVDETAEHCVRCIAQVETHGPHGCRDGSA